ncbi:ESF1 homolog [Pelobates cultripes]|uniref:ESF1 homolog n=1 Tax=Pelobates cultripes TaxID=61616 RepID=A0AAD1VVK4_PELCU|nr:ESF1 homolog [Pelobates cultripes]
MASKKGLDNDSRFSRVTKDPRFWEMPENERKIKIDKRFKSMFHDKKFNLKYTMDKRGRPMNHNTREDLKRFYDLSDSDELSDEEISEKAPKEKETRKAKLKAQLESDPPKTCDKLQKVENKLKAAGKGKKNEANKKVKDEVGSLPKENVKGKDGLLKAKQKSETILSSPASTKSVRQGTKSSAQQESEEDELGFDSDEDDRTVSSEAGDSELDEDSDSEEESEEGATEDEEGEDSEEDEASSAEVEEEDSDSGPDLARGKGNIETSSEDEDEDDDDEDIEDLTNKDSEIEHAWRELDKDAPRGDQITRRLAVCNMDWDRLKAKDLLALFNSFKPKGGIVLSVKVYPSEFGKERLKEEELHGPTELKNISEDDVDEQGMFKEKMRDYQFKRLKYFYAVVECDSPETANKIYEDCDGLEFESSCSFVDLRFVPDDVQFNDEPKDSSVDVDLTAYKPKLFTSTALSTSKKVELTWDETDHDRITALNRPFKKQEILDMDFQAYLASSSEEDEIEEEECVSEPAVNEEKKGKKGPKEDDDQIARYRELLKGIQEKDKKQENEMEMEVKWVPGLKENADRMVKNKMEGKDKLTPWEKYLQKQKDKRKLKKKKKGNKDEVEEEEDVPSDVDFNDPFFSEELEKPGLKNKPATGTNESEHSSSEDEAEKEKQRAAMALLMMDDVEEDKKHFNYDKIVEQQNLSKKKRKQLQRKEGLLEDDFQINVEDTRFQALYTSHLYNVDPSDPSFKKTKAMERVLEEKAKRREQKQTRQAEAVKGPETKPEDFQKKGTSAAKTTDPALSMLLKSVKNKTQQFQASKRQKTK